jgi:hypothetical protein
MESEKENMTILQNGSLCQLENTETESFVLEINLKFQKQVIDTNL